MKRYHYYYVITNKLDQKYYYGIHSTDKLDDGYFGSGTKLRKAIQKYGQENFTKEIVRFFNSREEASLFESQNVTKELIDNPNCYNLRTGGDVVRLPGGCFSEEVKLRMKKAQQIIHSRSEYREKISRATRGKVRSEETRQKISKARLGVSRPELRKPKSEEHRLKLSKALKGRKLSEEHVEHLKHPKYNSTYVKTQKHKEHILQAKKTNGTFVRSENTKSKISVARKGKIWVIRDGRKKLISPEESEKFIMEGYVLVKKR